MDDQICETKHYQVELLLYVELTIVGKTKGKQSHSNRLTSVYD